MDAQIHSPPILPSSPVGVSTRRLASKIPSSKTHTPPTSSLISRPSSLNSSTFSLSHLPSDPIVVSARTEQAALDKTYIQPVATNGNSLSRYVVNTCYLVWPVSERPEDTNAVGVKMESWQFPVNIMSHRIPSTEFYEGL